MHHSKDPQEKHIWVPLIGFDRNHQDKGVAEYYSTTGFQPNGISLFVFSPDIVHLHDGMEQSRVLPPDHCNYYGNVRNTIREIQPWTNHDLRDLVQGLEARGADTYMGLMGVFVDREPDAPEPYNVGHREWLFDHPELIGTWSMACASLNVLKRFKDGSYYEDFFVEKVRQALQDYGFSGVHVADNFCPPGSHGSARNGDFSDDMIGQFVDHSNIEVPVEVTAPVANRDSAGIKRRGEYIWNHHRLEWLNFLSWRWGAFFKKVCDGLHADGKKIIVNNSWCSEPFESVYRYGIDYKQLHKAGVDYMAAESLPTSVGSASHNEGPYRFYQYMTMPGFMKVSVPESKIICLNGVKDVTEEWDILTHLPCHVEREIYTLTNTYQQTANGLIRAMDGFMICLGDGLTSDEWSWIRRRWDVGFDVLPEKVLTPTFIWSDHALNSFLPDYIETRRWSSHKTVYEIAREGGQIGVTARIDDLHAVNGPIFIPNIDLLAAEEIEAIANYDRGAIICTSLDERNFKLPGRANPDLSVLDANAAQPLRLHAYGLGYTDFREILTDQNEDDGSPELAGTPRHIEDPSTWRQEMVFAKVSTGFVKTCARLIRACYECELTTDISNPFLPLQMPGGTIRVLLGNDLRLQYSKPDIKSSKRIRHVDSKSTFPVFPGKLLDAQGKIITPLSDGSHEAIEAYGVSTKVPPGGLTILDIELDS